MNRKLRVALIGCGQIADGHVTEIDRLPDAELVAVCDLEPLMAEQLAVRYGLPAHYGDVAEMLAAETPDVVHICTPPQSHLSLACQCFDAGCHVYVEKPFALDYGQCVELIEAARAADRRFTIGHTHAFDPVALDMRRRLQAGAIGDVVHVESWFGYDLGGPFGKVILGSPDHWVHRLPGKLFQNNINHLLHKITEFMPDERPDITAVAWRREPTSFGDVRDELQDELRLIIRGETVSAYGTFCSGAKPLQAFARLYGTAGFAHIDYNARTATVQPARQLPSALGRLAESALHAVEHAKASARNMGRFAASEFHFFAGLGELFGRFYANVRGEGPEPISGRDILRIAWMMDEIFRQTSANAKGAAS